MATKTSRKKTNFMIDLAVLQKLDAIIPAGEKSDFVNEALDEALIQYRRELAAKNMDEFRKKHNLKISTEEIIKLKNYGRP